MERLFDTQRIIIEQFEERPFYWRHQFSSIIENRNIVGILGPRGIGKTSFLLKQVINLGAKKRKALYVSADNIFFLDHRLIDLADYLYKQTDVRFLAIDEIHKYPNWSMELKNIADTYPSIQLFFSGSSMIDLAHSKYDLSRRVTLHHIYGFSFREYLEYHGNFQVPIFSLQDIFTSHRDIAQALPVKQILKQFNDYLRTGYYPFFEGFTQDREKFQSLENAVQMTIYEDIGSLHSLKTTSLTTLEQLFKFVINSSPGELNASKLAKNLGKDFESISEYLRYLQQAGLIRFIFPNSSGNAYLRNPVKMYPDNANLIHASYLPVAQDQEKGKIRETFIVNQIQNIGAPIFYSIKGDFTIEEYLIEIGGKGKTTKQVQGQDKAFVLADDVIVGSLQTIPLYLFGLLY